MNINKLSLVITIVLFFILMSIFIYDVAHASFLDGWHPEPVEEFDCE